MVEVTNVDPSEKIISRLMELFSARLTALGNNQNKKEQKIWNEIQIINKSAGPEIAFEAEVRHEVNLQERIMKLGMSKEEFVETYYKWTNAPWTNKKVAEEVTKRMKEKNML